MLAGPVRYRAPGTWHRGGNPPEARFNDRITVWGCQRRPRGVRMPRLVSSAAIWRADIPASSFRIGPSSRARVAAAAFWVGARCSAAFRPSRTPRAFAAWRAAFVRAPIISRSRAVPRPSPHFHFRSDRQCGLFGPTSRQRRGQYLEPEKDEVVGALYHGHSDPGPHATHRTRTLRRLDWQ